MSQHLENNIIIEEETMRSDWCIRRDTASMTLKKVTKLCNELKKHYDTYARPFAKDKTQTKKDIDETLQKIREEYDKVRDTVGWIEKFTKNTKYSAGERTLAYNGLVILKGEFKENVAIFRKQNADFTDRCNRQLEFVDEINKKGSYEQNDIVITMDDEEQTQEDNFDELEMNEEVLTERSKEIKNILSEISEIEILANDLFLMISDQAVILDDVIKDIESTGENVKGANINLVATKEYAESSSKWWCVLLLIIAIVVAIVVIIFVIIAAFFLNNLRI